jgi:hypothetical protein
MDTTKMANLLANLNALSLHDRIFIVENLITNVRDNDEEKLMQLMNQVRNVAK